MYWDTVEYENPLHAFMEWVCDDMPKDYRTIALAHNGGRFDMHFVLGAIYEHGNLCPRLIKQGEKLYQIKIPMRKGCTPLTIFRDTFNLMQRKLSELPSTLGLSVEDKGWFPYGYNKNENMHIERDNLPPRLDYKPGSKSEKDEFAFNHWYYANAVVKKTPFCLKDELKAYCMNDVEILAHAVVKFRKQMLEKTNMDIIANNCTIAGFCQEYFISKYMKKNTIAVIPDNGYSKIDKQSAKGRKFLKWLAHYHNMNIRTSETLGGEMRFGQYKVDGYVARPGERDLIIEFNGKM